MFPNGGQWEPTQHAGQPAVDERTYRRRIEPQQQSQPEPPAINPDDPSGPDNQLANRIRAAMVASGLTRYQLSQQTGVAQAVLSRFAAGKRDLTLSTASRLVPALGLDLMATDTSDSEPETMEQLRDEVATLTFELMAERDSGMIALQQLREQVQTLTLERDRYRNQLSGAIEHSSAAAAQQQVLERLQAWLRPVLELVAENPEDASSLAVAVLGYLPGIASRLIEE